MSDLEGLSRRLLAVEARLRRMEDVEAIRALRHRYCYAYDRAEFGTFMDCFAPDCRVELGLGRVADGRADVEAMFRKTRAVLDYSGHMVANPVIEVDGDTATGIWYLLLPSTRYGEAMWSQARYDEAYARCADGRWRIAHEVVTMFFATPYDKGWAREPIRQGLVERYAQLLGKP